MDSNPGHYLPLAHRKRSRWPALALIACVGVFWATAMPWFAIQTMAETACPIDLRGALFATWPYSVAIFATFGLATAGMVRMGREEV